MPIYKENWGAEWIKQKMPEFQIIDNFLTPKECDEITANAESKFTSVHGEMQTYDYAVVRLPASNVAFLNPGVASMY